MTKKKFIEKETLQNMECATWGSSIDVGWAIGAQDLRSVSIDPSNLPVINPPEYPDARSAWLILGDDGSYPGRETIDMATNDRVNRGDYCWTGSAHIELGDKLFFYFVEPRKAIQLIGVASGRPYWDPNTVLLSHRKVESHKWMVEIDSMVEIDPIPYNKLCEVCDERMILRGKSARYLSCDHANALLELANVRYSAADWCIPLVKRPIVGRSDLPDPANATLEELRLINWGSKDIESRIEDYYVEPLFRLMGLVGPEFEIKSQYRIEPKIVDYVIIQNGKERAVVEVKIRTHLTKDRSWIGCDDLRQARGYASKLGVPFAIIDCEEIFCFALGDENPRIQFDRRTLTNENLIAIRKHLVG